MSQRQTVLIIYTISLLMGLAAVLMAILTSAQALLVLIITTVVVFCSAEWLGVLRGKSLVVLRKEKSNNKVVS